MAQDEIENGVVQEVVPAERSADPRGGVGVAAAFLLHQSIYAVLTAFIALVEKLCGGSAIFQNSLSSLLWLVAWTGGAGFFWQRKRPRSTEWILPFTFFVVYWFLVPGWLQNPEWQAFALTMFLTTGTVWGLAILVKKTGFVLVDGHQQKEQIRRWISNIVPSFGRYHDAPQDILGRISSPPEPSPEILVRPAKDTRETAPQQLLRASQSEDQ